MNASLEQYTALAKGGGHLQVSFPAAYNCVQGLSAILKQKADPSVCQLGGALESKLQK